MRGFVEVLQIQRVVPDLIDRVALEPGLADLELQHEHQLVDHQHNVDPSADARQDKLEEDWPRAA